MSQTTLQKHISRLMALLLCALLLLPCVPMARAEEGTCGSSLTWSFDGNTLTISGSGAMTDYSAENLPPWYSFRESITRISLPDGLSRVGNMAFYECTNLASASIPSSVIVIGVGAFYHCSSMTMLNLNAGLRSIERKAFSQCEALADLRLPTTVHTIDTEAFYMCSSLTYVTLPAALSDMGSGVFSYCSSLIRVDAEGNTEIPQWTFYGCDNLQVVTSQGSSVNPENYMIPDLPSGAAESPAVVPPVVPPAETTPPDDGRATVVVTPSDGGTQTTTTVQKTENSTTVNSTQSSATGTEETKTEISSTVQNEDGWNDVLGQVNSALLNKDQESVEVTVMTPNSNTVSKEVLQEFAGKDVNLNIHTQSGTQVRLDCSRMDDEIKEDLDLSYTITLAEDVPESMAGCVVYSLKFHTSAEFDMEIIMHLPGDHRLQTASLYERKKQKDPALLQSVLVDDNSNAHFYLAAVDEKTDYLIGINVPGTNASEAIIPENLYDEYTLVDHSTGKQYVITGRKSSWNMGLGKVMAILAVVMVSAIGVIGFVMYFWNKQRLKNGYVPQWEDDEET